MTGPLTDPAGEPYPDEVQALVGTVRIEALIAAVESVRGKQADVCMEDPENILYFEAGSQEIVYMLHIVDEAVTGIRPLRVAIDHGALKLKVGDQSWSAPMRSERENGGYPR